MKVQMTGSYPCINGTLPTSTGPIALDSPPTAAQIAAVMANIARMPKDWSTPTAPVALPPLNPASFPSVNPGVIGLANALRANPAWPLPSPPPAPPAAVPSFRGAPKVHVFSPAVAAQSPAGEKVLDALRALSGLITPHCGQKVAIGASAIWLAVDGMSAHQTFRDPESKLSERVSAASAVGSDLLTLCSGILGTPGVDQAATALNFVAMAGDHVYTGKLAFEPSDIVSVSNLPDADEVSSILKLTELVQPDDPS